MGIVRRLKNGENLLIVKMISEHAEPMTKEDIRRRRMEGLQIHSEHMWRDRVAAEVLENLFWPQVRCAACRRHDWDNCTCKRR